MRCRFEVILRLAAVLLLAPALWGCVSLKIEKSQEGVDVLPPPDEFVRGKTSLKEILSCYGAPDDLVDMNGDFALHFKKALYRGINFSIELPLKNVAVPNPSVETSGDLLRYDTVVFILTADNVMKDIKYEKGTSGSLWGDYWQ